MTESPILYKYLPPERVDVLERFRIRFTQPTGLNDPYECTGGIDPEIMRQVIDPAIGDLARLADELRRERPTDLEKVNGLVAKLDRDLRSGDLFRNRGTWPSPVSIINPTVGVLSLSQTPTNVRMWSLYADSHRGFCLGFDATSNFIRPRKKTGERTQPLTIEYTESPPVFLETDSVGELLKKSLGFKSPAWQDEREVRVLRPLAGIDASRSQRDPAGNPILLWSFPPNALAVVIIGAASPRSLYDQIRKHCEAVGAKPKFKFARVVPGTYRFELMDEEAVTLDPAP